MHKLKMFFLPAIATMALASVGLMTAQEPAPKTLPKPIYQVQPQYTEAAKAAKITGTVLLKLVVDANGDAQDVQVAKSLDEGLDQNAIAAVRQWRFAPGTENGKPVATTANIEVNFKLQ